LVWFIDLIKCVEKRKLWAISIGWRRSRPLRLDIKCCRLHVTAYKFYLSLWGEGDIKESEVRLGVVI
jgi:hypothetical protein